jgi:hypothetical protein
MGTSVAKRDESKTLIAALALIEKRDRLLKEAFNADPYRMAPAWLEHSVTDMLEEGV